MTDNIYVSFQGEVPFKGTSFSEDKGFIYFSNDNPVRKSVQLVLHLNKYATKEDQKQWTKLFQNSVAKIVLAKTFYEKVKEC